MDEMDRDTASRESLLGRIAELAAVVAERDALIAALQERIGALEERLGARRGPGMPGHKPPPAKPKPPPKARKKRARGFGRGRMAPTATVAHAVETCPDCGTRLVGRTFYRPVSIL